MGDVVVTGVGAVTPLGIGAQALSERWAAGVCAISGGEAVCGDYDPADHFSRKEARRADRFTQLALVAAAEAIAQSGWDGDPNRAGCIFGTGIGGLVTIEANQDSLREQGPGSVSPLAVPLMMGNASSAQVAVRHDLRGPVYGIVSACAAGANAVAAAVRTIQAGDADVVVTGGSESALTPLARAAFAALDATSNEGICRPFDARRDGFIMGEGAGALVLEDGDRARARGATVLATVKGVGASCDAFHLTAPSEDGEGAARAITAALADAGIAPSDVDYINAHGTSTPLNDRSETLAIKTAFGADAQRIPVSSAKSAIGHLLGAAGAVEAIATIGVLHSRVAAPTLGLQQPEEGLDLDYVPGHSRPLDADGKRSLIGVSNSFGFGGHNAVLVLETS